MKLACDSLINSGVCQVEAYINLLEIRTVVIKFDNGRLKPIHIILEAQQFSSIKILNRLPYQIIQIWEQKNKSLCDSLTKVKYVSSTKYENNQATSRKRVGRHLPTHPTLIISINL